MKMSKIYMRCFPVVICDDDVLTENKLLISEMQNSCFENYILEVEFSILILFT